MSKNILFGLWSPTGNDNMAFSCFAQAQEGDFTVGQDKLNKAAELLAYNWVYGRVNPNDPINYGKICNMVGFDYETLLSQEVDYLAARTEEEIKRYGATG